MVTECSRSIRKQHDCSVACFTLITERERDAAFRDQWATINCASLYKSHRTTTSRMSRCSTFSLCLSDTLSSLVYNYSVGVMQALRSVWLSAQWELLYMPLTKQLKHRHSLYSHQYDQLNGWLWISKSLQVHHQLIHDDSLVSLYFYMFDLMARVTCSLVTHVHLSCCVIVRR